MWRKGRKRDAPPPDVPEALVGRVVGTPMSNESVLLLARLQSIADQLERAVYRLERQTDAAEEDEAARAAGADGEQPDA